MAINDPNYRYATMTWDADGVRTEYEISFQGGYIRQSDVVAFSVIVDPDTGLASDRQVHPLTFISESGESATVQITPAVASGRRVVIFRSTEKARPMVSYSAGSVLTKTNLDLANKQAVFGIAEIMDGLAEARIVIDNQTQEVIDQRLLVNQIYQQVLELLAAGGIVSVAPRVWSGVGDGESTDFPLVGADVSGAGFYDTYVSSLGLEPDADYSIILGETIADTMIRFAVAPADGSPWFTVLRGYARPYTGPAPITTLAMKVIEVPDALYFVDKPAEFSLLRCTNPTGCSVTVNAIPLVGDSTTKMGSGSYLSLVQRDAGQVTVVGDVGVTLVVPAGCIAATRAVGSVISLTCESGDGNVWIVSGDLAAE